MNTRRTRTMRFEDNEVQEEINLQVEEVEHVPQDDQFHIGGKGNNVLLIPPKLSNSDIREVLLALTRVVTTQVNSIMQPKVNFVESTMKSSLRDFVRVNNTIFIGSKVGEDHREFLERVYKVLNAMGVTCSEKAELAS
ncbi:hypothetical protein EJD97_010004 [Solanum chilense]|uniref:Uncharacterized protein n=1 Tax=Solanum chilense TaxID=4083 RepID=A0A6N2BHD0_SOLCI|nr:hypothetical protein EJD97_010004 [Solanum chilense]